MASSSSSMMMAPPLAGALLVSLSLTLIFLPSAALAARGGAIICEELPQDLCSFAISSSSKRCVLESYHHHHQRSSGASAGARVEFQCRTSEVTVERFSDLVETDQCVRSCGVDRQSVGISSDALLDPHFTASLCSPNCYHNCPNIIDLYFNLAAGEGVFLPDLCQAQRSNPRRAMAELLSSGVAAGPAASAAAAAAAAGESDAAPASMPFP